jgi:hypothetical protein
LTSVAKSSLRFDNTWATSANHSITYGSDGLPLSLVTDSDNGHLTTTFTHDNNKRLTEAETTSGFNKLFVGTTRYEYDADGNIPKVYYTINLNQQIQEVLARENLSFDTKDKFYIGVPELKIVNEYVYGFLPNKNNCLESTVYYYNYAQRFVEPQAITLTSAYDEQGLITSLKSATSGQFYSGEVLFNNVLYNCN